MPLRYILKAQDLTLACYINEQTTADLKANFVPRTTPLTFDDNSTAEDMQYRLYDTSYNTFIQDLLIRSTPPFEIYYPQNEQMLVDISTDPTVPEYVVKDFTRFDSEGSELPHPLGDISPLFNEIDIKSTRPFSYILTVSSEGFGLCFKSAAHPFGRGVKWLVAQRLVDKDTGEVNKNYSPVVCLTNHIERPYIRSIGDTVPMFSETGDSQVWQFVVRESDTDAPSIFKSAIVDSEYMKGYWNNHKQISVAEKSYILTLPQGINTDRHFYQQYCMNLLGFISANVLAEGVDFPIDAFPKDSEKLLQHYIGLRSTLNYNEGQRVVFLAKDEILDLTKAMNPVYITGVPLLTSNKTKIVLNVHGDDLVSFKYKVNSNPISESVFIKDSTQIIISGISDGITRVDVWGTDNKGRSQIDPTTVHWSTVIDKPTAVISTNAEQQTTNPRITFSVENTNNIIGYAYSLNHAAWSKVILMPKSVTLKVPDGTNVLKVIALNKYGNWQREQDASTFSWLVDTKYPIAEIFGEIPEPITYLTRFELIIDGPDTVSYKYQIDNGYILTDDLLWSPELPADQPLVLSNLDNGKHIFKVIAKDILGNWQPEEIATEISWIIDTSDVSCSLTGLPEAKTKISDLDITIFGRNLTTYKYALNGGTYSREFPITKHIKENNLPDGNYVLSVLAKNYANNWQPETFATEYSWMIRTAPPVAVLTTDLHGAVFTKSRNLTVTVSGTNVVAYLYSVDGDAWSLLPSNISKTIDIVDVADGVHRVTVRAIDDLGNIQTISNATFFDWTVDNSEPISIINGIPTTDSNLKLLTITISGNKVKEYSYKLDAGIYSSYTDVSVPIILNNLTVGRHTLSVLAKDSLGNIQNTIYPTVKSWNVI